MRINEKDEDFNPEMPEIECRYLVDLLFKIGPSMGEHALTHGEIESWQRNTGICLNGWECETLKSLSNSYLSASFESRKYDCKPPWMPETYKATVARDLENEIENLIGL